ncbi:hypothetical protein ROLI_009200 [Roseobacter fucihabitans]|uniref:Excalibur calcium-binding domain-containing protein n=1 Tax=Roseobacter fucihabitans TaxID=1537242 RepID=A0ABZ2BRJ5_9RHOB|nr:hypothetical protein [Roseobacter litoralis]MBC6967405.1 hypothetical protein [Roseobacter litoralis]
MTPRAILAALALTALTACTVPIPDSGSAVGFDNSLEEQRQREAALARNPFALPDVDTQPLGAPLDGSPESTAAETTRILNETRPGAADTAPLSGSARPVEAAPIVVENPGISDENDFDAVAERQTIESDAARIANNKAQYEVVQPEALPTRSGDSQPNIVSFALETKHPKGQSVYARAGFGGESRAERNCADYTSSDQAQIDFLERGGPVRDRRGLDPDGDGYACGWDPAPFRRASGG